MRKPAVFTIVQNEPDWIMPWADYYAPDFEPENTYVLHHQMAGDGEAALAKAKAYWGFTTVNVDHEMSFDSVWLPKVVGHFQKFLLSFHQSVLFTAADEFVLAHPDNPYGTVPQYMEEMGAEPWIARCQGFEVVHDRLAEPPFEFNRYPILRQRRTWYPCKRYSKPLAASIPIAWTPGSGFAKAANAVAAADPYLLLLHLHRIDYDHCLLRHRERAARRWRPEDRAGGVYRHNILDDPEVVIRWLTCHADDTGNFANLSYIPEQLRDLL